MTHQPGSAFESCPAATGVSRPRCPSFPDGAHRCGKAREHEQGSHHHGGGHLCSCGLGWISATINDGRMPATPIAP